MKNRAPLTAATLLAAAAAALDAKAAGRSLPRFLPVRHVQELARVGIENHGRVGQPPALPGLHGGTAARDKRD